MKVLILGYGAVGSVLCKLLSEEKSIESIVCGDVKKNKKINNKKIRFKRIDASDKTQLLKCFKNINPDLIINASLPSFNVNIMECCLHAKINYMDMASYWDFNFHPRGRSPYKVEQLDYDGKFKQNNLIGLINAGASPGLTNLLARECADFLDTIDCIKIRLIEDTGSEELVFAWSKEWLLDEINWNPIVYRNKKFKIVENFSEEEEYDYPPPLGKRKACLISQEEVGTIPLFVKTKNLDIKSCDSQIETVKLLVDLGLVSERKVRMGEMEISPLEFLSKALPDTPRIHKNKKLENAVFGLVVEAVGKRKNEKRTIRCSAVFPTQKEINKLNLGANFISYPTALMAKMFILSFPKIKRKGVFPPECLDKEIRQSILEQLKKNHIPVSKDIALSCRQ